MSKPKKFRVPLNCLIVAVWLWISSLGGRGRRYIWKRPSYKFKGAIPHAGVAESFKWRTMSVIEYIPNHHDFPSFNNFLLLFVGRYRVWKLRAVEVRRFHSARSAMRWAKEKS